MTPLADRVPDAVASFQHDRSKTLFENMRGGGKPDRAGSDNRYRLCVAHGMLPSN
jgi:hypothetical protein